MNDAHAFLRTLSIVGNASLVRLSTQTASQSLPCVSATDGSRLPGCVLSSPARRAIPRIAAFGKRRTGSADWRCAQGEAASFPLRRERGGDTDRERRISIFTLAEYCGQRIAGTPPDTNCTAEPAGRIGYGCHKLHRKACRPYRPRMGLARPAVCLGRQHGALHRGVQRSIIAARVAQTGAVRRERLLPLRRGVREAGTLIVNDEQAFYAR